MTREPLLPFIVGVLGLSAAIVGFVCMAVETSYCVCFAVAAWKAGGR